MILMNGCISQLTKFRQGLIRLAKKYAPNMPPFNHYTSYTILVYTKQILIACSITHFFEN